MFSQPAPIAVGDDGFAPPKQAKRDEDGRVETGPIGFKTNKQILGKTPDALLFSKPGYITVGDPFKKAAKESLRRNKDEHEVGGHDARFKLTANPKERLYRASYPYAIEGPPSPKEYKDEDGAVKTELPNMKTNPMKKGRTGKSVFFENKIEYIADDYNIAKKMATEEREYHYTKIQDKPFSQVAKKKDHFFTNKQTYMEDPPMKPKVHRRTNSVQAYDHDRPFRGGYKGKAGNHATFEKFPEHVSSPYMTEKKRKPKDEDEEELPGWKSTHKGLSRPMASIATNMRNLKSSYPSAFRSPR